MKFTSIVHNLCLSVFVALVCACDPEVDERPADVAHGDEDEEQAVAGPHVVFVAPGDPPVDASELEENVLVVEWTPDTSLELAAPADPANVCVWYPIAYDVWGPGACGSCTKNGQPGAEYWVFMKDCSSCGGCGAPYIRTSCGAC